MKQHVAKDIKVTDNTRTTQRRWRVNYVYELCCLLITWWRKTCLCRVICCKACIFNVSCQKKSHEKRKRKGVTLGWTDISGPGPASVLSVSYLTIISTVFLEHLILHLLLRGEQTSWDGWNMPNKQFQSTSICFSCYLSGVNKKGYFRLSLQIQFFMST